MKKQVWFVAIIQRIHKKLTTKVFKGYFISIQQNKRNVKRKSPPIVKSRDCNLFLFNIQNFLISDFKIERGNDII